MLRFIRILSLHQGLNSSLTTQVTLGPHSEGTHLHGLPSSLHFPLLCLSVSPCLGLHLPVVTAHIKCLGTPRTLGYHRP